MKTVKACPQCGLKVRSHCYHDGMEVYSVDMPLLEAINLARCNVGRYQDELENSLDSLDTLLGELE